MTKRLLPFVLIVLCTISAHAGLKEWIHGVQPAATPGPPDATAAKVTFAEGVANDKAVMDFLQAFAEALRVHDGSALKPRLSPKFTIEDLPAEHNAVDMLMQGMMRSKSPNEIIVTAVEREGELRVARTEFHSADRPSKTRAFRFDAEGKLVSSDLFQVQRQGFFSH